MGRRAPPPRPGCSDCSQSLPKTGRNQRCGPHAKRPDSGHNGASGRVGSSGAVRLDEREDILLGQLVWILGLLGVMHTDAIPPFPEEPAIVADAGEEEKEGQRAVPR